MASNEEQHMTVETFNRFVQDVEARPAYQRPAAFAIGIASFSLAAGNTGNTGNTARTVTEDAKVLDTWFPVVNLGENFGTAAVLADLTGHSSGSKSYRLSLQQLEQALERFEPFRNDGKVHANVDAIRGLAECARAQSSETSASSVVIPRAVVVTFVGDLADKPVDVHDVFLRLHLLSYRKVKPREQNLDGIFGLLNNVVWTDVGPFDPDTFSQAKLRLRAQGINPKIYAVDKIPHMTDYVVPSGVRIADAHRVRLGAYLAEGTTIMQEGFCNFNAGTLGPSMVEGRISAGVIVGAGSDIGGGASIMGTLSGGGKEVITIGENCLIGANAGTGISLGDGCQIQSGCYITDNAKIKILPDGPVVKAAELSGKPDLRYWRNSITGQIEAQPKRNQVVLNPELHKH